MDELKKEDISKNNVEIPEDFISLCRTVPISQEDLIKELEQIEESVQNRMDEPAKKQEFDFESLKKRNFIPTDGAKNRLNEIYNYIRLGIPILIEGPTGTAKTFTAEIIINQLMDDQLTNNLHSNIKIKGLKKFSLCQDTKPSDLMGSFVGDSNALSGLKLVKGVFVEAYEEGYCLLLDEINLATKEVLQCIEDAIDSKVLSFQNNGEVFKIKMNPNFCLIATQNPNKGKFAGKRQELGTKFLSKFMVIEFPGFSQKELLDIANGLAQGFGYYDENNKNIKESLDERKQIIEDLVDFHFDWSQNKLIEDDIQCFTIREISATVKAISDGESPIKTITIIYGARYLKDIKLKMIETLQKRKSFKDKTIELKFQIPDKFSKCFQGNAIRETLESIFFSFKNKRNVIISGNQGTGKTTLALWVAEYFEKLNNCYDPSESSLFVCTEDNKPSDLIGKQKPMDKKTLESGGKVIKFEEGNLTKAIRKGKICILDNIEQLQPTVTERLNASLDKKYNGEQEIMEIPENPELPEGIPIHENYRLLCTANIEKLNKLSPAFINRFDVIVLEDQLSEINNLENKDENLEQLIKVLFINSIPKTILKNDIHQLQNNGGEESDSDFSDSEEDEPNPTVPNDIDKTKEIESTSINTFVENDSDYVPDDEFIKLVKQNYIENLQSSNYISIYNLAFICRGIRILNEKFEKINEKLKTLGIPISKEEIVLFTFKLCLNNEIDCSKLDIPINIQNLILKDLPEEPDSDDSKFFYLKSEKLKKFMTIVHCSSMINLPLIIYGSPGVGKTAMIRAYGRIRQKLLNKYERDKSSFQMYTFHNGTKPNDFFGTSILKEGGEIGFVNGTLTTAINDGFIFIADEMNVSSPTTMKSIAPALEPCYGRGIYFPNVEKTIFKSELFEFIACQNFIGTIGRNLIPDSINSRFRVFNYPEQDENEIQQICKDIKNDLYKQGEKKKFNDQDAEKVASFMFVLNNSDIKCIQKWSFRDIKKLFKRIHFQDQNPKDYMNLTVVLNLLFYILSPLTKKEIEKYIDEILNIIKQNQVFDLNETEINDLKKCINETPKIQSITDDNNVNKYYLMKGECGLSMDSFDKLFSESNKNNENIGLSSNVDFEYLPSFINDLFKVSLADFEEPILLTGPTGYKTFLAQQFLPGIEPINLNPETTVEQLLGSPMFLYKSQAKDFYLSNLCMINGDNQYEQLKEKLENGTLTQNDIKLKHSLSFDYALRDLKRKLFEKDERGNKNTSGFSVSDIIIEFNLGLILKAIFSDRSLLLKNLSEIQTSEFERFNELFSAFTITLHEDIYNTFTPSYDKEIKNFSKRIRFFATCQQGASTKLSEAVLSRFTPINIETYEEKEQNYVLKSYNNFKNLGFSEEEINKVIDYSIQYKNNIKKNFLLPQMINTLYITSKMNQKTNNRSFNLSFVLYYLSYGLQERRKYEDIDIEEILLDISGLKEDAMNLNIPLAKNLNNETPLIFEKDEEGYKIIKSKLTNLSIRTTSEGLSKMDIYFSQNMIEMINLVHFSLVTHIPLIFEAELTQGKKTSIKYVIESVGLVPIFINLIPSLTVADLLGKVSISKVNKILKIDYVKTKLRNALENSNETSNSIIIFENINNASPAVLQLLSNIFDYKQSQIPLPNNTLLSKAQINVIGLWNPQNGFSSKEKIPSNLINSSIYFIFKFQEQEDLKRIFSNIIEKKFKNTNFSNDYLPFYKKFILTFSYLNKENETTLNLNDVDKYIILRESSEDLLDENTISKIIFAYCNPDQEKIDNIIKILGLDQSKFKPTFTHNFEKQELYLQVNKDAEKRMILQTYKKDYSEKEIEEIELEKSSLTPPEKQCLLCLGLCHKSRQTCLIGGGVASGKTSIIRLFAKIMGKEITTYEMDSDTDSSFISGQPKILDKLEEEEIIKISYLIKQINDYGFKNKIIDDSQENIKKWGKNDFNENIEKIKKELENIKSEDIKFIDDITNEEKNTKNDILVKENIEIIQDMILPANRFKSITSTMVKALKNGDWILIDNIQLAPPQIIELISSLCGSKPSLDLVEKGDEFSFSSENDAKNKIHDDFRIFITIDPTSSINSNVIEQSLRPKCINFNLPPIDSKAEYSAQIFHSALKNSIKNVRKESDIVDKSKIYISLASKLADVHNYVLEQSKINGDDFSGGCQITGRRITSFCKEFNNPNELKEQIIDGLRAIYYNSYINHEINEDGKEIKFQNFKKSIINEFKKYSKYDLDDINLEDEYFDLLNILRNIQLVSLGKTNDKGFDLGKLTNLSLDIKICDLNILLLHFKDTYYNYILKSQTLSENKKIEFGQIRLIISILEEISKNKKYLSGQETELQLKDQIFLKNQYILNYIIKLNLLQNILTKDELYFTQRFNFLNNLDNFSKAKEEILKLYENENLLTFSEFLQEIKKCPEIYEPLFPNSLFINNQFYLLNYLIPLIIKMIKENSYISITFTDDIPSFVNGILSKTDGSLITELIIKTNNLFFAEGSKIKCYTKKMEYKIKGLKEEDTFILLRLIEQFYNKKNVTKSMKDELKKNIEMSQIVIPPKEEYFNFSYFFSNPNNITVIGGAISLCFNTNEKFLDDIYPFLLNCEKDMLNFVKKLFH